MDIDTLITAMLYPVVNYHIVSLGHIKEDFGANIAKLAKGVLEMDNIRQQCQPFCQYTTSR